MRTINPQFNINSTISYVVTIMCLLVSHIQLFGTTFPTITSKTLSNDTITLPKKNTHQLMIIGLDMKSSAPMQDWVNALNLTPSSSIEWVQLAVIGGVPPFVDGFIKNGMKSAVPQSLHSRYIPYFGNKYIITEVLSPNKITNTVPPFIVLINASQNITLTLQGFATTDNIKLVSDQSMSDTMNE